MLVARTTMAGGAVKRSPRKSAILRQIRALEKRRRQLQEKLDGRDGGGSGTSESGASRTSTSAVLAAALFAASHEDGSPSSSAAIAAAMGSVSATCGAGQADSDPYADMDAKDILKLIALIDLQINALLHQLGDDAASVLTSGDGDAEDAFSDVVVSRWLLPNTLPPAASSGQGTLDEYA